MVTALAALLVFSPFAWAVRVFAAPPRRPQRRPPAQGPPVDLSAFESEAQRRLYGEAPKRHLQPVSNGSPRSPRRLRIAMLAPPWIPIPPPGYGGIEAVLDLLCPALVRRGHDVTLFAAPGTKSEATVISPLEEAHADEIERALWEADHVARAVELIEGGVPGELPYDVIHDHCGFVTMAMADRIGLPVVHTLHGPLDEPGLQSFYRHHGHKVCAVAISRAQAATAPDALRVADVIPNPIDVDEWPFGSDKDDYLLWVGRMNPVKGPQRAIEVARRSRRKLILAGPVQPGQEEFFRTEVEPHLRSSRIAYLGEVGGKRKRDLFARASALLMPIRWPEPFGMVMVEALAAGTPVIAFPEGAASEIVEDGETGFLTADETEMAKAVKSLDQIDPARCRAAAGRFDSDEVAAAYERVYRRVSRGAAARGPRLHVVAEEREPTRAVAA